MTAPLLSVKQMLNTITKHQQES